MTRLQSRYVTVKLAGLDGVAAVVEADEGDVVVLSLAVPAPAGLERALERPVVIETATPRGLRRVHGHARWHAARPDELRLVREVDEVVQRRDTVRVDAVVPALLLAVDGASGRATTTTVNVSGSGVLVRDPLELPVGAAVRVELELEGGGPPVRLDGTIVREAGRGAKGMHFEATSREDRNRLARFVAARERAQLGMGSGR